MSLSLIPAHPSHTPLIAPYLRQADLDEIAAASGETPELAVHRGIVSSSEALTAFAYGLPVAVFGVVNLGAGEGSPWLLGTDRILLNWRDFARLSRQVVAALRPEWRHLHNYVDARNTVHVRWLTWLGARLAPPAPHGRLGLPFHHFTL